MVWLDSAPGRSLGRLGLLWDAGTAGRIWDAVGYPATPNPPFTGDVMDAAIGSTMTGTHTRQEDFPWMIAVVEHPERRDSPAFVRSRTLMRKLVATTPDWILEGDSYQDHHGGSVWVKDADGWLCLQLPLGIEWSAQFCADPAKVERLRRYAARVVAAFPETLPGYDALGYRDGGAVLATPVTDAAGVAAWTDSIFNAGLPVPAAAHTGVLPKAAGYHHYPKPIVDIDHFRFDDFRLFVTDPAGLPAVVVPISARGRGDGRVRLLAAHPDSLYVDRLLATARSGALPALTAGAPSSADGGARGRHADGVADDVLPPDDPLARQAFAGQS
jgi:hypothetical protein